MSSCHWHRNPYNLSMRSLDFRKNLHRPQDILDEVKYFTYEPNQHQINGKRDFVDIYIEWAGMKTVDDVDWLDKLSKALDFAMKALDAFFFANSLTRDLNGEGVNSTADLKFEANIFAKGRSGHGKYPRAKPPLGLVADNRGRTTIYIDAFDNGAPQHVTEVFDTLVHEMAHAVYRLFACWGCERCSLSDPAVLGQKGHGLLWVEMMKLMMTEIQSWDEDLSNFMSIEEIMRHHRRWP